MTLNKARSVSLNRISCRNCKLYLLPGVFLSEKGNKDFGELVPVGAGGVRGSTVKKKELEPSHGAGGGRSGHHLALCPSNTLTTRFQEQLIIQPLSKMGVIGEIRRYVSLPGPLGPAHPRAPGPSLPVIIALVQGLHLV